MKTGLQTSHRKRAPKAVKKTKADDATRVRPEKKKRNQQAGPRRQEKRK